MKRTFHGGEFLYFLIHGGGIVLADGFRYLKNLHGHRPGAHGNLDFVPDLYVVTGLDHAAVDADVAVVAGFVGDRPALDQARDFEILVKPHRLLRHDVLQSLACLEGGNAGSGDLDGFLGVGVAANAGFPLLGLEGAEAGDLHLVALYQSRGNGVNGGVDDPLGVLLGQAGALGGGSNQFSFVQVYILFSESENILKALFRLT